MELLLTILMAVLPTGTGTDIDSAAQTVAQERADYMARRNHRWHPPFAVGRVWSVARFEGAGWGGRSRDPKTLGTCRPRRRGMRLVADAVATGRWGVYRIRLWR